MSIKINRNRQERFFEVEKRRHFSPQNFIQSTDSDDQSHILPNFKVKIYMIQTTIYRN